METINVMGIEIPVSEMNGFPTLGVWVTAQEVLQDGLLSKFDIVLESWDGLYTVHSIDSEYRAIVGGGDGGHTVSLHAGRKMAAFSKR